MELFERFALGDTDAFETVFGQFQGEVYRWILRIVRDPAAAEDLTIETFWRIYRSRARFDAKRGFGAWAHRIAIHLAFSHLKTAGRHTSLVHEAPAICAAPDSSAGKSTPQSGWRSVTCRPSCERWRCWR